MIERLLIQNLVLIDRAEIRLGAGLNILTGETGSGKSAVLSALRLILGERADVQLIGSHGELSVVEADIVRHGSLHQIRREMHRSGKNRCFVNDELVSLTELRALFTDYLELADQGAAYRLFEPEELRKLLDAAGRISLAPFEKAFQTAKEKRHDLDTLRALAEEIRREEGRLQELLVQLSTVDWKPGEEEELLQIHSSLASAEKSVEKYAALAQFLSEENPPLLPTLKRFANQLPEVASQLETARANLEEVSLFVSSYLSDLDCNGEKLARIEKRLSDIEAVKRKYARTQEEAEAMRKSAELKLLRLSQIDEEIRLAENALKAAEGETSRLANHLTEARTSTAETLAKAILLELGALNLQDARLEIQIHPKSVSANGCDEIRWLFSANPGQPLLSLELAASGGELSRLLLAIKMALKEKKCLILDEIDGNVGGHTAALLGRKLQELAHGCQIICVTHFVQVAKFAMHHFLVSKKTNDEGAITSLQKLDDKSRAIEYARMTGSCP